MHDRLANLLGATAMNVADLALDEIRRFTDASDSASAALVTLADSPDLSVTQLGQRIGLSQPAAARMVDGLVSRGLVERRPARGRSVAVRLTRAGRQTVAGLLQARSRVLGALIDELEPDEQVLLAELLDKVLHAIHGHVEQLAQTPKDLLGILLCRLCDRTACREDGAPCPVTQAQQACAHDEGHGDE